MQQDQTELRMCDSSLPVTSKQKKNHIPTTPGEVYTGVFLQPSSRTVRKGKERGKSAKHPGMAGSTAASR